ncbi:MAG TPA: DUF2066 domain-containing protein [Stellaceae bacterium]|nr:DUF2066 domain-containing protein [Stellaceae bacterium]
MAVKRALVILAFAVLAWPAAPARAQPRDVFTVAAVPVDATAANANAARDQARRDGEHRAYQMLLERLTLDADHARLPPASDAALDDLVKGFEVAHERTSGVRYLANYTYHFDASAVRKILRDAHIPFCETPSKPLVVLAVFENGAGSPALWEDPNPWRDAWGAKAPPAGLVPLVLPYGDLNDVQAVDADGALKGDPARLQAIASRYNNADVLVAEAALKSDADPHTLAVNATRYTPGGAGPPQSVTRTLTATPAESDGDLLAAGVAAAADAVEDAWKQANILDYSHTATITVRVPASDLAALVDVRNRLAGLPAIERSDLVALNRTQATLAIHYFGDPAQLRTALAQRDLVLDGQDPDFVLERAPAPAH